jgi:cellulose synthase/poly-beta-1,6-N-acetylglucosamine synthase-like glycosyltransferase
MILELMALILIGIHFGTPLAYYWYAKVKWLSKLWNIATNENYRPKVTVIVPTFNEASIIEKRLNNIYEQDYPKDRLEIIVVDSASNDSTAEIAKKWTYVHSDVKVKVIEEPVRRGKIPALNFALSQLSPDTEIVTVTDADCIWEKSALKNAVKYLADPLIGAVTCTISPLENETNQAVTFDKVYRNYNNLLRIAESKAYSTPIAHGPFIAYKRSILTKIGGIPAWSGADDSTPATLVTLHGYRFIQAPDVITYEYMPRSLKAGINRRIRRAHHLIEHFLNLRKKLKEAVAQQTTFSKISKMESFLHLINPWFLAASVILLLTGVFLSNYVISISMFILAILLITISKAFRTWIITQLILMYAQIQYLLKGSLTQWTPIKEAREVIN